MVIPPPTRTEWMDKPPSAATQISILVDLFISDFKSKRMVSEI
jgi:hypothetical protein